MSSGLKKPLNNRPLSPHMSVYKPQITSATSIFHRISGIALYLGAVFLAIWIISGVYGCDCLDSLIASSVGQFFLFLWSLALFFHMLNGVRYLFWSMGKGIEIKCATWSGILVLSCAFIISVLVFCAAKFM